MLRLIPFLFVMFGLAGCGMYETRDFGPSTPRNVDHISAPVPKWEPRTRAGNKSPYTVLGKTYRLMDDPSGYHEVGEASWYGYKFHGRNTANGEVYNMYGMTAAHKTLPIPSYVEVTNLANKKSVIVRVNDRGPFHDGRIIDLTYSAAKKLDFVEQGVAKVKVRYLDPRDFEEAYKGSEQNAERQQFQRDNSDNINRAPTPFASGGFRLPDNTYVQVGAFNNRASALSLLKELDGLTRHPVRIYERRKGGKTIYRVLIGQIIDKRDLRRLQNKLKKRGYAGAFQVSNP